MTDISTQRTRGAWGRTLAKGALMGLCVGMAWTALVWAFGTARPFEVVSGHSMLPTLHTGEVVVVQAQPPWRLRVGEIVAVGVPPLDQQTYHYPPVIVHRIVALGVRDGVLMVRTKGDNEPADPFEVPAVDVRGRMLAAIPDVGYGWLFLQTAPGRIAVIGLALLTALYGGLSRWWGPAEALPEPVPANLAADGADLALAIREYGAHLRSHTRVVRELGATTVELRRAAQMQNAVLADLGLAVTTLAAATAEAPSPVGSRRERRQRRRGAVVASALATTGPYPRRRERRRRHA